MSDFDPNPPDTTVPSDVTVPPLSSDTTPPLPAAAPAPGDSSNPLLQAVSANDCSGMKVGRFCVDPSRTAPKPDATDLDCDGLQASPFCINPNADPPDWRDPKFGQRGPWPGPDPKDVPPETKPTVPSPLRQIPPSQCTPNDPPGPQLKNPLDTLPLLPSFGPNSNDTPPPSLIPPLTMPSPTPFNQPQPLVPKLELDPAATLPPVIPPVSP
jgi:hypothetical protein